MGRIEGLYTGNPGCVLARLLGEDPSIERILTRTLGIPGRVGLHQAAMLVLLARQHNAKGARFCNIGTFHGYSAALLARGAPAAKIIALEPDAKRVQSSRKHLARLSNVEVLQVKSWDYAGKGWDLVFVDGYHPECARDLIYYDRLVPGGIILFHDYTHPQYPQVREAVDGLVARLGRKHADIEMLADGCGGLVGVYKDA